MEKSIRQKLTELVVSQGYEPDVSIYYDWLQANWWVCLGKALGWKVTCLYCGCTDVKSGKDINTVNGEGDYFSNCAGCGADWLEKAEFEEGNAISGYIYHWHKFIDHLIDGKDANLFFKTLLTNNPL